MNSGTHMTDDHLDSGVRSFRMSTRRADSPKRTVGGNANGLGVWDSHGTRFMPGAFTESIAERQAVPVLWGHDRKQPIGKTTSLSEQDGELRFEARLTAGVQRADEALALIADEAIDEVSIGFEPQEWRDIEGDLADEVRKDKRLPEWWPIREFTKARVREVSPVAFGSNPNTDIAMRAARERASSLDEYRRLLAGPIGAESPEAPMTEKNQAPAPAKPDADNDNLDQIRGELAEMKALLAANKAELAEAKREREEAQHERDFVRFCADCTVGSTFTVADEAAQRALFNLSRSDEAGYSALAATSAPPAPEQPKPEPAKPRIQWGARHGSSDVTEPAGTPTTAAELRAHCLVEAGGDINKANALYLAKAKTLGIL